jgi:hypothetical protein
LLCVHDSGNQRGTRARALVSERARVCVCMCACACVRVHVGARGHMLRCHVERPPAAAASTHRCRGHEDPRERGAAGRASCEAAAPAGAARLPDHAGCSRRGCGHPQLLVRQPHVRRVACCLRGRLLLLLLLLLRGALHRQGCGRSSGAPLWSCVRAAAAVGAGSTWRRRCARWGVTRAACAPGYAAAVTAAHSRACGWRWAVEAAPCPQLLARRQRAIERRRREAGERASLCMRVRPPRGGAAPHQTHLPAGAAGAARGLRVGVHGRRAGRQLPRAQLPIHRTRLRRAGRLIAAAPNSLL